MENLHSFNAFPPPPPPTCSHGFRFGMNCGVEGTIKNGAQKTIKKLLLGLIQEVVDAEME